MGQSDVSDWDIEMIYDEVDEKAEEGISIIILDHGISICCSKIKTGRSCSKFIGEVARIDAGAISHGYCVDCHQLEIKHLNSI